ncbi:MAG TPA: porin family protein [Ohtaekwangia sp.]|uniref:porin family protein n=1 Tax=Ohtaekwangia sp. TaxID=2066019 RepID=UPI002F934CF1
MKNNRLKFLMIAVLTLTSAGVFAQAQFAIGIKAGPNFANLNTSEGVGANYKNRTGFHAGAFALIKLSKIGIQPEVLFSQQGSTFKYSGSPDLKANFSYVNVPILIKLYTIAGINIQAGPQFGFLTSAKRENYDSTSGQVTEQSIKNDVKKSDVSVALGLGWDLPFGLTIDGRYNLGLSDINSGASAESIKNQVWQFSIGYKLIKLGK